MNRGSVTVRRLSGDPQKHATDWNAVFELCCLTGNDGAPIARERWDLFGRLWVEPYRKILPQWLYVAEAQRGIVGYLTGCPNTGAFGKAKFWRFSLPLLVDIFLGRYRGNREARRFVRQVFRLEKQSERAFSRALRHELQRDYPAHLHMNVDAAWQRSGVGTRLVEAFFSDLRNAHIPGVHLYCDAAPLEFYQRQGFKDLAKIVFHGVPVYALGLRLQD
jgi:GNAT superfamily N-acetyltransferase